MTIAAALVPPLIKPRARIAVISRAVQSGIERWREAKLQHDTEPLAKHQASVARRRDRAGQAGYKDIEKILRPKAKPDTAIREVADSAGANLIVMAATRRVGDMLYLGQTAEGILRRWKRGIVLVVVG